MAHWQAKKGESRARHRAQIARRYAIRMLQIAKSELRMSDESKDIFDVDRVRDLVEMMIEHGLTEVDLRQHGQTIRLRRGGENVLTAAPMMAAPAAPLAAASPAPWPRGR